MAIHKDAHGKIVELAGPGGPDPRPQEYAASKWTEGPLFVEVRISDELPPGYALLGWTKFPYNIYILITAGVDLLWIHKRINVAFWLRKERR